jgi:hypothetical protein
VTRFRHWRKMTWAIVLWSGAMAAWLAIGSLGTTDVAAACATDSAGVVASALTRQECINAAGMGEGARAIVLAGLWALGSVVLGVLWFLTRPLWRQGHGARLRRLRPEQVPRLYEQTRVPGSL